MVVGGGVVFVLLLLLLFLFVCCLWVFSNSTHLIYRYMASDILLISVHLFSHFVCY